MFADKEANEKFSEYSTVQCSAVQYIPRAIMDCFFPVSLHRNLHLHDPSVLLAQQYPTPASRNRDPCKPTGAGAFAGVGSAKSGHPHSYQSNTTASPN